MSTITLSSLKFIKPAVLAHGLSKLETSQKIAIIDVRDSDHIGGHIKGSQWIPSNELDMRMPELLRQNSDKDRVVFHCMLSQQRGPKAALSYARAKQNQEQKLKREKKREDGAEEDIEDMSSGSGKIAGQEVCVLEGGFEVWKSLYGEDDSLTAGYVKDIWR